MKRLLVILFPLVSAYMVSAQESDIINKKEVERIEKILASDDMQGRHSFSPGIEKAAAFIADEFTKAGLQPLAGSSNFFQPFSMMRPRFIDAKGTLDGTVLERRQIIAFTTSPSLQVTDASKYEIAQVKATDTFRPGAFMQSQKNTLVIVDPKHESIFSGLTRFKRPTLPMERSVVFVLSDKIPQKFSIDVQHEFTELKLNNVAGVLPGKSKKEEFVIFSAHYDHLGIGKPNTEKDSIFNGANDDASGTTAVVMLANHFRKLGNNERTLVFVTFTAEELGMIGSQYFSGKMDPAKVAAMFNIEMIGTESKWGTNSAFITGYERSDLGKIMEKNLEGSKFKFYPDPYSNYQLFYRSDNATLARQGVPAHTISTSKMDVEKFYHTQDDEVETLNFDNMTEIIKAIALSSASIVNGKETPSRVDASQLNR